MDISSSGRLSMLMRTFERFYLAHKIPFRMKFHLGTFKSHKRACKPSITDLTFKSALAKRVDEFAVSHSLFIT